MRCRLRRATIDRPYRDADWLRERYHGEGLTQREIAAECGVSPRTIRTYMDRFGIETRNVKGENHPQYGEERSEEAKARISETLEGREVSEEWRRRIAEGLAGNEIPDEVRRQISESLSGIEPAKRDPREDERGETR